MGSPRFFLVFGFLLALPGCASGPDPAQFTVYSPELEEQAAETDLAGKMVVASVEDMPATVDATLQFSTIVTAEEYQQALSDSMALHRLLATDPAEAEYRLVPRYIDVKGPFKIGAEHDGIATFGYRVERLSDGAVLFDEEIESRFTAKGTGLGSALGAGLGAAVGGSLAGAPTGQVEAQAQVAKDQAAEQAFKEATIASGQDPLATSGPGPFDASQRVVYAMKRSVRLNIAQAIQEMTSSPAFGNSGPLGAN